MAAMSCLCFWMVEMYYLSSQTWGLGFWVVKVVCHQLSTCINYLSTLWLWGQALQQQGVLDYNLNFQEFPVFLPKVWVSMGTPTFSHNNIWLPWAKNGWKWPLKTTQTNKQFSETTSLNGCDFVELQYSFLEGLITINNVLIWTSMITSMNRSVLFMSDTGSLDPLVN